MNSSYKIAVINPDKKDGLVSSLIDGLIQLEKDGELEFFISSKYDFDDLETENKILEQDDFLDFAKKSDLIFLVWGKNYTDYKLAKKIGNWGKTIFVDGSEVGRDRRYDFSIQNKILKGKYKHQGAVNKKMLKKCLLYFRREKPYLKGVEPLPYGIERRYYKHLQRDTKKDIDFFCVFGQEEYPVMRKYAKDILIDFCKKNKYTYHIKKTKTPSEFHKLLSRSKVGVSIGGGGYDTYRFWEILGNNCFLLTESLDIFDIDSNKLDYNRIFQFNNLYDFNYQLEKIKKVLDNDFLGDKFYEEYRDILEKHSSKARVESIIEKAQRFK